MFRGTAGIGVDMYDAWVDGSNAVTHDDVCMDLSETSCGNHYRHTNVTDWSRLGITQVNYINGPRILVCTQSEMADFFFCQFFPLLFLKPSIFQECLGSTTSNLYCEVVKL